MLALIVLFSHGGSSLMAEDGDEGVPSRRSLEELKVFGAAKSSYLNYVAPRKSGNAPQPRLESFQGEVAPVLQSTCVPCHGPDTQEGNLRIDTLDPDFFHGKDVAWWLEVLAMLTKGEMPPRDEVELSDADRSRVVEWLSTEIQLASHARRSEQGHSSFRRMTRYEYNYALQDILGLSFDFAKDLPPESTSEDGFQNSSEMLHMSAIQLATYRESALKALKLATVDGDQPPASHWSITMEAAAAHDWEKFAEERRRIEEKHKDNKEALERSLKQYDNKSSKRPNRTYYADLSKNRFVNTSWNYGGAKYATAPSATKPKVPPISQQVAIIPRRQKLIVELGDTIPVRGSLRVRIRASRTANKKARDPSLQLEFGWQASNDSQASVRISPHDLVISAEPEDPEFYEWTVPLSEIYPRNSVRNISQMGDLPSPSEYIKLVNSSESRSDIQIDYVEVTAPVYDEWPTKSHQKIFGNIKSTADEAANAKEIFSRFISRAWRRPVTEKELAQKVALFGKLRPLCDSFEQAVIEVLATALSSPKFLYLVQSHPEKEPSALKAGEVATRLSMFLWSSIPDDELSRLADENRLGDRRVLTAQVDRMLADPRSRRFSKHFMRQWLGMELLDYLDVDRKAYRSFDPALKEAMQQEPIELFTDILHNDASVLDFLHAEYTQANERLARHYGLKDIYGNHFRRVSLDPATGRGGLLTSAGLLAMNSDGKDSHPLKRGIWLLERLLNDPPPPPPPAVPEIDLTDPEIAKMTLKERIEDHRNDAACLSCHQKIDPWGIAFENYDAIGNWRTEVQGKPVDASSRLFNGQPLEGMDGLKRFLLENRQDQFVKAMVHKMTTYALGRPLNFGDLSSVDKITADVRKQGDGLAKMVSAIVTSDLFQAK